MAVTAVSPDNADLRLGAVWVLDVEVVDADCVPTAVAPVVTVTRPDDSTATPAAVLVGGGVWRATYTTAAPGRHTARVVAAGYGATTFVAYVREVTAGADMPTVDSFKVYAKIDPDDTTLDDEIATALAAETAAQRRVCRVPAEYPDDLREALHRRVARNLAMRGIPLAVLRGDSESGDTVLPGNDPEVRRLEKPYPWLVMG